jgi:hypothetical protein
VRHLLGRAQHDRQERRHIRDLEVVLGGPDRVEAEPLGLLGDLERLPLELDVRARVARVALAGDEPEAELYAGRPARSGDGFERNPE